MPVVAGVGRFLVEEVGPAGAGVPAQHMATWTRASRDPSPARRARPRTRPCCKSACHPGSARAARTHRTPTPALCPNSPLSCGYIIQRCVRAPSSHGIAGVEGAAAPGPRTSGVPATPQCPLQTRLGMVHGKTKQKTLRWVVLGQNPPCAEKKRHTWCCSAGVEV